MLMRSFLLTILVFSTPPLCTNIAPAEDARALLDRAIKAHGGEERLQLTKKGHLKAKTEVNRLRLTSMFEIEEWFDLPSRFKRIVDTIANGVPIHQEEGFIGGKSWSREGTGPVLESPPLLPPWNDFLTELLLLRDKNAQLATLADDSKVGRPLAGLRAIYAQNKRDYFFDKSNGLLVARIGSTNRSPSSQFGPDEKIRTFLDDYRDIQGILYPMRWKVVTDTYSSTITISSIEFVNKIDEKVFQRPRTPVAVERETGSTARDTASHAAADDSEKSPQPKNWLLFVVTVGGGLIVGALWFIVRANKRGKRDAPTS